jgi:hypothetical protein
MTDARLQALYQEAVSARRAAGTVGCPTPERVWALVERQGSEEERLETLDHALSCPSCARELELLRALRVASPAARRRRTYARWLLAASALVAVTAGTIMLRPAKTSRVLRGDARGGAGIALLAPKGGGSELRWHAVPRAVFYTVEVLDSRGTVMAGDTTRDTSFVIPASAHLTAASAYHWWVRARRGDGSELRSVLEPLTFAR